MDKLLRVTQPRHRRKNHTQVTVKPSERPSAQPWLIAAMKAKYLGDYKLRVEFSDGRKQSIDFGPFLRQSLNPLIRKYLDVELFKQFTVAHGDLFWNDYDLCFPVADLYANWLFKRADTSPVLKRAARTRAHNGRKA